MRMPKNFIARQQIYQKDTFKTFQLSSFYSGQQLNYIHTLQSLTQYHLFHLQISICLCSSFDFKDTWICLLNVLNTWLDVLSVHDSCTECSCQRVPWFISCVFQIFAQKCEACCDTNPFFHLDWSLHSSTLCATFLQRVCISQSYFYL